MAEDEAWARTTAEVDQTIAALKQTEYEILRFRDSTKDFINALKEQGIGGVQAANIIHGMAISQIFPDE